MMRETLRVGTLFGVKKGGRVTRYDMWERVRYSDLPKFGERTFIVNDNVHRTNSKLSGLLVHVNAEIGCILRAEGYKALYRSLLPRVGEVRMITLYDNNLLPLQQVGGPLVWDESKIC